MELRGRVAIVTGRRERHRSRAPCVAGTRAAPTSAPPSQSTRGHGEMKSRLERRHGYVARRYGKRQIEQQPDEVIAELLEALG